MTPGQKRDGKMSPFTCHHPFLLSTDSDSQQNETLGHGTKKCVGSTKFHPCDECSCEKQLSGFFATVLLQSTRWRLFPVPFLSYLWDGGGMQMNETLKLVGEDHILQNGDWMATLPLCMLGCQSRHGYWHGAAGPRSPGSEPPCPPRPPVRDNIHIHNNDIPSTQRSTIVGNKENSSN